MIRPPTAGTTSTSAPTCASAGDTGAVEKRKKKNRLVAKAISASSALARTAPTRPMTDGERREEEDAPGRGEVPQLIDGVDVAGATHASVPMLI